MAVVCSQYQFESLVQVQDRFLQELIALLSSTCVIYVSFRLFFARQHSYNLQWSCNPLHHLHRRQIATTTSMLETNLTGQVSEQLERVRKTRRLAHESAETQPQLMLLPLH